MNAVGNPEAEKSLEGNLQDIIAETDTGARSPKGSVGKALLLVALSWSLFQIWYASPLPFILDIGKFNSTEARSIHLAFAVFLSYTLYPAFARSARDRIQLLDWIFAGLASFTAAYLLIFYQELSQRPGDPTTLDVAVAVAGILLLLEATRRALGPPLMIVAGIFLFYIFAGPYMPEVISHKGASVNKAASHLWLYTEGVFGVALGVSTSFVFLFVLFGSLLDKAGAGNYFIKVAFSLLGHMRGGPAKAAVLASGMTGMISGSSIANVVTTGTFTIPLMKRMGLPAEKAGAVEVAASSDGQIMPPIMGAAAFLMSEFVGIPYEDVIRHAFLPAVISYLSFIYIMHLEALKFGMSGLEKRGPARSLLQKVMVIGINVASILILAAVIYYAVGWIKTLFGDVAVWVIGALLLASYLGLTWYSSRFPDLEMDDPNAPVVELPEVGPTVKSGLHFLLPVVVLVWCLMIEHLSPGLSAFYAVLFMIFILLTQRPLIAFFRGQADLGGQVSRGGHELLEGLITGARNMIGIGVATAAAGIIVGAVTLTGIGQVMTEFVEWLSGGSLLFMLFLVALISLILGMGLPTTANYIVVSSLMAPVVVALAAQHGLIVPLIAVHLFVFYFGIMADVTPPVGLASFAASAISGADPIRTGVQAFIYAIRTGVLPFMFIFNTELLLIGVDTLAHGIAVFVVAAFAMMVFAAGTQGYFLVRSRFYESVLLVLVAFSLVRPGFWMDMIVPPYTAVAPQGLFEGVDRLAPGEPLRLHLEYYDAQDTLRRRVVHLDLPPQGSAEEKLEAAGLGLIEDDKGRLVVDTVGFDSPAEKAGVDFDMVITGLDLPTDQPDRRLIYIPALLLLGVIIILQRRRQGGASPTATATATGEA